ncbi:MAG: hypothetical protein N3A02_01835 [Rectinema sp.]|nr:hypothetical protein [Rectinema sp.]
MGTAILPHHPLSDQLWKLLRSFSRHAFMLACCLIICAQSLHAQQSPTSAQDFDRTKQNFTVTGANLSGSMTSSKTMIEGVGNVVTGVSQVITGPVLYVVMGLAVMLAVFGFIQGKMMMAFMGVGAFILAGALKALFGVFTG